MGDLVLTEDEVNPVMSALLEQGLEVTALHNHFFWEQPRIFYMHVHGMGKAADLADRLKPAIAVFDKSTPAAAPATVAAPPTIDGPLYRKLSAIPVNRQDPCTRSRLGAPTSRYKITEPDQRAHGTQHVGSLCGTDADAMVAGDVAMLEGELQGVLKALRSSGLV